MKIAPQMQWPLRMAAVLLLVGLADVLVVMLASRPLPWAILISSLTPLLTVIFVIIPMLNAAKQ
jgi:hypothetical protein